MRERFDTVEHRLWKARGTGDNVPDLPGLESFHGRVGAMASTQRLWESAGYSNQRLPGADPPCDEI